MADVATGIPIVPEKSERKFFERIQKGAPDECWPYVGPLDTKGYSRLHAWIDGEWGHIRGHRWAYYCATGKWSPFLILHSCDNRACCNPAHLREGTHEDNMRDMRERGRSQAGDRNPSRLYPERRPRGDAHGMRKHPERVPRGERSGNAKLNDNIVRRIRELAKHPIGYVNRQISYLIKEEYGIDVHVGQISAILRGEVWAHVV